MAKGGKRPGAGRPKGKPNKVTAEARATIASRAREFSDEALEALAGILRSPDAPAAAKVSAATSLLDRGYGKPPQSHEHSGEGGGAIQYEIVTGVDRDGDEAED